MLTQKSLLSDFSDVEVVQEKALLAAVVHSWLSILWRIANMKKPKESVKGAIVRSARMELSWAIREPSRSLLTDSLLSVCNIFSWSREAILKRTAPVRALVHARVLDLEGREYVEMRLYRGRKYISLCGCSECWNNPKWKKEFEDDCDKLSDARGCLRRSQSDSEKWERAHVIVEKICSKWMMPVKISGHYMLRHKDVDVTDRLW